MTCQSHLPVFLLFGSQALFSEDGGDDVETSIIVFLFRAILIFILHGRAGTLQEAECLVIPDTTC